MLIGHYELKLVSPPCEPGSERWSAFAEISTDIACVLPYLNVRLRAAIYNHEAKVLTWRTGGHSVSLRPHEIAISSVKDRAEAKSLAERMVRLINRVWERRDRIEPSLVRRERLRALDVYNLLPRTNCKACGHATCFLFALHLVVGQIEIEACPELAPEEYRVHRKQLMQMLQAAGVASLQRIKEEES